MIKPRENRLYLRGVATAIFGFQFLLSSSVVKRVIAITCNNLFLVGKNLRPSMAKNGRVSLNNKYCIRTYSVYLHIRSCIFIFLSFSIYW